jgi:hypothetical protein
LIINVRIGEKPGAYRLPKTTQEPNATVYCTTAPRAEFALGNPFLPPKFSSNALVASIFGLAAVNIPAQTYAIRFPERNRGYKTP